MPADLGAALFRLLEADQGHAYISDAVEGMRAAELREIVEGTALPAAERVVAKMRRWLRDNPPSEVSQWSLGG